MREVFYLMKPASGAAPFMVTRLNHARPSQVSTHTVCALGMVIFVHVTIGLLHFIRRIPPMSVTLSRRESRCNRRLFMGFKGRSSSPHAGAAPIFAYVSQGLCILFGGFRKNGRHYFVPVRNQRRFRLEKPPEAPGPATNYGVCSKGKKGPPSGSPSGMGGTPLRRGSALSETTPSRMALITMARRGRLERFSKEPCTSSGW